MSFIHNFFAANRSAEAPTVSTAERLTVEAYVNYTNKRRILVV